MFEEEPDIIVDWNAFSLARSQMGASFVRMLDYFKQDGDTAVERIESAMQRQDCVGLVSPADRLGSDAREFGAVVLADLAEEIEVAARRAIENHLFPDDLIPEVAKLRPLYRRTIDELERAANPLAQRRTGPRVTPPVMGNTSS